MHPNTTASSKNGVDPLILQMLWQGITSVATPHDLPNPDYIMMFQQQEAIGWNQIYMGRISNILGFID